MININYKGGNEKDEKQKEFLYDARKFHRNGVYAFPD